jgi:hypothetical protein
MKTTYNTGEPVPLWTAEEIMAEALPLTQKYGNHERYFREMKCMGNDPKMQAQLLEMKRKYGLYIGQQNQTILRYGNGAE